LVFYSHVGQIYEPVDRETLLYYREAKDGQILEEGITEAGSMSSFIAAGTAYSSHGIYTVPFFVFYSMFGFQRVGDLIWAAADCRVKGFLVGGTAGRTTLAGEGLQHQDGHSHLLAYPVPNLKAYDPAFAFELAVIIQDGFHRMYELREDIFYYLTVMNENYVHPPMPAGPSVREGILKGMYRLRSSPDATSKRHAQLLGSGAILNEVLKAQEMLADHYEVAADVWSVTSYKELYRDGLEVERWNLLHPADEPRVPYVRQCIGDAEGVFVQLPITFGPCRTRYRGGFPRPLHSLGTDGFGRSEGRAAFARFL
jgi:pyruvate dehydrogenase E1 component